MYATIRTLLSLLTTQDASHAPATSGPAAWPRDAVSTPTLRPAKIERFVSGGKRTWSSAQLHRAMLELRRQTDPRIYRAFELYVVQGVPAAEVCRCLGMKQRDLECIRWHVVEQLRRRLTLSTS